MSLTRRTVVAATWAASGAWGQAALRLGVVIVLARLLSPDDFGTMALALSFSQLALVLTDLGVGQAVVQRRQLNPEFVGTATVAALVMGVVVGGAVWVGSGKAAQFFASSDLVPILRLLSITFPVRALGVVSEALLQRDLRFRELAMVEWFSYGAGYGAVTVGLALAGFGVWALVVGVLSQTALRVICLAILAREGLRFRFEFGALKNALALGGGFAGARIANFIATEGDNFVVGRMLGTVLLGSYTRAYQLLMMPVNLVGGVIERVLFPAMAIVQESAQRLGPAYARATAALALILMPVSVVSFVLAPELVSVLLGEQWDEVIGPFRMFCLAMTSRATYKVSVSVMRAVGAVYRQAVQEVLYASAVFVGALAGSQFGLLGVAAGVSMAVILNGGVMARSALSIAGLSWRDYARAHSAGLRVAVIAGTAVQATAMVVRQLDLPSTVVVAAGLFAAGASVSVAVATASDRVLGTHGLWAVQQLREMMPPAIAGAYSRWKKPR